MRQNGSRTIKVNKQKLIDQIELNRTNHIEEYEKAVIAYRKEARKQLDKLNTNLVDGKLDLSLQLVTPINKSEDYEKIIQMFEWEVDDEVELDQKEFNEYVQDETGFAVMAKMSNSTYF